MSKQQSAVTEDLHLAIVTNPVSGLFHGAIYRNIPTPSGCDRFLLSASTKQGYATQRSAAIAINNQCLDITPIDLSSLPDEIDEDIDQLASLLPKGAFLTHITPRQKGTVMEDDVPGIEQNSSRNPASSGAGQASPYQSLADMALDCFTCFPEGGVLCCSI